MLASLIGFCVHRRPLVLTVALILFGIGGWFASRLSLDVVPDISPVQVEILTPLASLAAEEAETSVTRPVELEMAGLPGLEATRSLTRFGLSQVILTFRDGTDVYRSRQLVTERLAAAQDRLPRGVTPTLAPIATGLGEVFTYALRYRDDTPPAGKPATASSV